MNSINVRWKTEYDAFFSYWAIFNGYATDIFPPIDPVKPELINLVLGAIFEEMCNVISFTTVVTGFTLFNFNVTYPIITWNNSMCNIILKGLNFCISYCCEREFKYSWPNIILSIVKVCIMIRPFMYWSGCVCLLCASKSPCRLFFIF